MGPPFEGAQLRHEPVDSMEWLLRSERASRVRRGSAPALGAGLAWGLLRVGLMAPPSPTPAAGTQRPALSLLRGRFPHFFGSLALLFMGLWLWRSVASETTHAAVDYSEFYHWLESDQIASVTLEGQGLEGELKKPKSIAGHSRDRFTTTVPLGEDGLLPLLRKQDVRVRVVSGELSFGAGLLLSLLPWV